MRKRRFPAAIRFHKKRQDVDPFKFFLSELMLYFPFRDEKEDLHSDNEELCAQLYLREEGNIKKVKMQVMEHLENVEEARFMVDEYMKTKAEEVGVKLDPENEQINDDCDMEEEISHPDFEHLDPNAIQFDNPEKCQREKTFKQIDIGNVEELRKQTKLLDKYQKYIIQLGVICKRNCQIS